MKVTLTSLLLLALGSCTATTYQKAPVPPQNVEISSNSVSRIYVLRTGSAKGYYRSVDVKQSEGEIGRIGNDHYLCWERPPTHTLLTLAVQPVELVGYEAKELYVDLNPEAGKVYYYGISVDSAWGKPTVRQLEPAEAREELKALQLPPKE
jgi:hypothetical protein